MNIGKTLTNPYVLGIGAIIGVGVLMYSRDGSVGRDSFGAWSDSIREYNRTAMEYAVESAKAAYALEAVKVENTTQRILGALSTTENLRAISAHERVAKLESDNGVINTQLQTQAAIAIAKEQAAADRESARYAYKSAKKNAELDFFGDAIGTVGKVIGSIF